MRMDHDSESKGRPMSLETLITELTAQMKRVGDLLEVSNNARAELIAQHGGGTKSAATTSSTPTDAVPTVAEIKAQAKDADKATLEQMLADEEGGKNRTTAVDAIKAALANLGEGKSEPDAGAAESTSTEERQAASPSSAPNADDKNAQPVPAEVSGEAAGKAFANWFGETDDEDERANRRTFVAGIVEALGNRVSELDLTGRRKAIFFLRRKRANLEVDFAAAYDFDGSPTQAAPTAGGTSEGASGDDDLL